MCSWKILPCSIDDAPALARNNMAAFWEDPTWKLLWPKDTTLDFLVKQGAKRQPRNLLRDRKINRHQKAVDSKTGEVVGYARWVLPELYCHDEDGRPTWAEAQMADVTDQVRRKFEDMAESAWWKPRSDMNSIDDKNVLVMNKILEEKPYIKLDYLAVHPKWKGKRVATALVASGIPIAEKHGVSLFTMAFKAGRGVYARLGFQEIERVIQDDLVRRLWRLRTIHFVKMAFDVNCSTSKDRKRSDRYHNRSRKHQCSRLDMVSAEDENKFVQKGSLDAFEAQW